MPISADTTPVVRSLQGGREYLVRATGGSVEVSVDYDGDAQVEGSAADGETLRLEIATDERWADVTFTPSGAGVNWSVTKTR